MTEQELEERAKKQEEHRAKQAAKFTECTGPCGCPVAHSTESTAESETHDHE